MRTEHTPPQRSTSLSRALSDCREQLQAQIAQQFTPESLQQPIRRFAALARREEMPPERVLALLKEMLHGVASFGSKTPGERSEITTHFVQMAIQAYYGDGDGER